MNTKNFPQNRKRKQEEAQVRQTAWSALTPQQQLQQLDDRLGRDVGAGRQRGRLLKKVDG